MFDKLTITICLIIGFSIISGCIGDVKNLDKNEENTQILRFDESVDLLKKEMKENSSIYDVSLLDIEGEKAFVVLIYDPLEAEPVFNYSSKMCDIYLEGYGLGNITIDIRNGKEQLIYEIHQFNA
ncbi:MAG: hypothetical protein PWQ51_188 [Methanolobus sp.]|jgi:hypothetical protein|nr:hypothetical protein [Methanolobus sp.]MDK2938024.1 hypothetical protein [Methanolobus sp.]